MTERAVSRCGLYCDTCDLREKMNCPGCAAADGKMFWGECRIARCSIDKGHSHCGDCGQFPCDNLTAFANDPEHGDHGRRIRNLQAIRGTGFAVDPVVAICGTNCDKCPAYQATKAGDRAAMERMAAEWTKALGKPFTSDDIACEGCRTGGKQCGYCSICEIRACAVGKSHATCAHCDETDCARLAGAPDEAKQSLAALRIKLGR